MLKNEGFHWDVTAQKAFDNLKLIMSTTLILHLLDFNEPFSLFTDSSSLGMGAILQQKGHPIAFFSKKFCLKLNHSSTYVRELHAITATVHKWRQYLLGREFIIFTDQKSIRDLINQVIQTPDQHFYFSKLLEFNYKICYRPGQDNQVVDALSRIEHAAATISSLMLLSALVFDFRTQL